MFNKRNLVKLSFYLALFSIILYLAYAFQLEFNNTRIVNNIIDVDIVILAPIKTQILDLLGQDFGSLLFNLICLNLGWYMFVVLPVWLINLIKGVLFND